MKLLRKRFAEREYYGRRGPDEGYIKDLFDRHNMLPPTRMRFCARCGSEIRWFRETPGYGVGTGKPGHSYHLKCPHFSDTKYEQDRWGSKYDHLPSQARTDLLISLAASHYNGGEYRFRESDAESFDAEALW